jgi:hypothetical protein
MFFLLFVYPNEVNEGGRDKFILKLFLVLEHQQPGHLVLEQLLCFFLSCTNCFFLSLCCSTLSGIKTFCETFEK